MDLRSFILIFWGGILVSCNPVRTELPVLQKAEQVMSLHPDSAQSLLEGIQNPEELPKKEYATWCLLITQAHDKNFVEHTTDSFINIAFDYFEKQNDAKHYAASLFYKGRILQDWKSEDEAVAYFVKALDVAKHTSDAGLLFLVSSYLGSLYVYRSLPEQALCSYQDAYRYAIQSKDSSCISYACSYLGRVYSLQTDWEQALSWYEKAAQIAEESNEWEARRVALEEKMGVYMAVGLLDELLGIVSEIQKIPGEKKGDPKKIYFLVGEVYRYLDDYEKAIYNLKQAFQSEDLYTLLGTCQCLYYLYEEQELYKEAVNYNNMYLAYSDSIQKMEKMQIIIEAERKYNHEKVLRENLQLASAKDRIVKIGLLVLVFLLCMILLIIFINQNRLKKRNLKILQLKSELSENERSIKESDKEIADLSVQLSEQQKECSSLEKRIQALNRSNKQNELQKENLSEQLKMRTKVLDRLEKKHQQLQDTGKQLKDANRSLRRQMRGIQLNDSSVVSSEENRRIETIPVLVRMQNKKSPLQAMEWRELFIVMDSMYENFVQRLRETYPNLTEDDLRLCCLIKLRHTDEEITQFLSIAEDSLIKRKQRLRHRLDKDKKWVKRELEAWICSI